MILEKGGKTAILLPGPPGELYPLFEKKVAPYLQKKQPEVILSQMVKICGYGESQVEDKLLDLIDRQTNPTIATYAKTGEVHLRITARAKNEDSARKLLKPVIKEVKKRFEDSIYSVKENETLEGAVVRLLEKYEPVSYTHLDVYKRQGEREADVMIKSMTGFGRFEEITDDYKISVEMKAVNHRYLDLSIKMPKKFNYFEAGIRTLLKDYIQRGKVDVFISYEDYTEGRLCLKYRCV